MSTTIRPLRAQLRRDGLLVAGLDLALARAVPPRSSALNAKVAMPRPALTVPIRRRSSSGDEERASASSRVILPLAHELDQRGVHRLHAVRAAGLERGVDLVGLALADQVADRRGRHEHLDGDAAALAVGGRQELLGDDALEGHRQLHAHLLLLRRAGTRPRCGPPSARCPACGAWRRRGGRSRPRSARSRSSRGLASRRRGSRRGPGAARPSGRARSSARRRPARAG